jgi:hypothetical protein
MLTTSGGRALQKLKIDICPTIFSLGSIIKAMSLAVFFVAHFTLKSHFVLNEFLDVNKWEL